MPDKIEKVVQDKYASVARSGLSSNQAGVRAVAEAFGYTPEELASLPAEANMGLSCGNPTAFATLRPGEVVVDLGSGGGLDVFLAAKRVGSTGKAIPIDTYRQGLIDAGLSFVEVVDSGKDLNAYSKAENACGCCSTPQPAEDRQEDCCRSASVGNPVEPASSCCAGDASDGHQADLHERLADLLRRYDVNDYAASVKVYAVR